MVDQYINAHAGTQNLFDIGKSDGNLQVGLSSALKSSYLHILCKQMHGLIDIIQPGCCNV